MNAPALLDEAVEIAEGDRPFARSTSSFSRSPAIFLCALAAFSFIGIGFAFWLRTVPAGNPDPRLTFNVFYLLFSRNEPTGLLVVALFSLVAAFLLFRGKAIREETRDAFAARAKWLCPLFAIVVFAIASIGTENVFHGYALTADEYLADFQARIFLRGKIQAEVPAALVDAVRVIKPTYVDYFPATHSWNATYLPVYAAMRAAFQSVDAQTLLNPLLAAVTVLALYAATRNIWPETKLNALVAIALLASSSQFLLMSMTSYAMPAHLALNSIWLWLYSRPDRRSFYLAPLVGVLAIGLHQPFFHALFAAPFLIRLARQRRWKSTAIFAAIYITGCACWLFWWSHFRAQVQGSEISNFFRLFSPRVPIIQSMNLWLILGWSSLATPLLVWLGLRNFFKLKPIVQDALLSCALTFGFYFFFYLDQAHGWGYRYFHGVLACFILVAVAGFDRLSILAGARRAQTFVLAGVAASLLIQLPLRAYQAEQFVRPYAETAETLHAMRERVIGLDARDAWYSADLIRNDPFLEQRPIIFSLFGLTPPAAAALQKAGSARFITRDDLTRLGMFTNRGTNYGADPFQLGRGK